MAIQVLQRASRAPTNNVEYWTRLGTILLEVARRAPKAERVVLLDNAINAYQRVVGLSANRGSLLNLGIALMDRGRNGDDGRLLEFLARAIATLEEHLLSNPQDARAHSSMGLALFTKASATSGSAADVEFRQASAEFRDALLLNGRSPELFDKSLLALCMPNASSTSASRTRRYAVCQILALVNDADHCLDEIEWLVDDDPSFKEIIPHDPVFRTFLQIALPRMFSVSESASTPLIQ